MTIIQLALARLAKKTFELGLDSLLGKNDKKDSSPSIMGKLIKDNLPIEEESFKDAWSGIIAEREKLEKVEKLNKSTLETSVEFINQIAKKATATTSMSLADKAKQKRKYKKPIKRTSTSQTKNSKNKADK